MKKLSLFITFIFYTTVLFSQSKQKDPMAKPALLPDLYKSIVQVQQNAGLFIQNLDNHSKEKDVNFIVVEMEKLIDSMPRTKTPEQNLLIRHFQFLRGFFLATTNNTSVATSFLYNDAPYRFCTYNDSANALYLYAIKDGDIYNLAKTTEKKIATVALESCLLPSLKPFSNFTDVGIRYVALSIYFGCKDSRDGAPDLPALPYCLTIVVRNTDLQQFASGMLTAKGLLANAELYLSDMDDANTLKKLQITFEQ